MSINLYNVDCLDYIKGLPNKAYDLAIVDPPYGIGMNNGNGKYSRELFTKDQKKWDDQRPDEDYFNELFRVSVNQIIWGANYFTSFLPPSMGWICWYKTSQCKGRDMGEHELAFTSFQRAARHFEKEPFHRNGSKIHPTQKPVALYKWLFKNYAKPGDKILDTHGGGMSIAIAAYDLGFDLDLCELDPDYFKAGQERLNAHIAKYAPASEVPVNTKGQCKLF